MNASASLRGTRARALTVLVAGIGLWVATPAAQAMTIERVVSPGGIEAWLVRDSALPLIAVEFAVLGSADQDPPGKPGVANMAASLLDEGAGPFDAAAFQNRLERKAIELSFRSGRDYLRGTLRTLKPAAEVDALHAAADANANRIPIVRHPWPILPSPSSARAAVLPPGFPSRGRARR